MIPPIAALYETEPAARFGRQFPHRRAREGVVCRALEHGFDPGGVRPRLIPNRREPGDTLAKGGFGRIERARLDGVVETIEAVIGLGRALAQLPDMLAAPLDAFLPAIQKRGEHDFDPLGIEHPFLKVSHHHAVQLIHGDRAALAAGLALPRLD